VAYRAGGETFEDFPPDQTRFHHAEPVYEELEGWADDLGEVRTYEGLPAPARKYLERLADLVGVPLGVVSVGPAREQSLPVP
jgi:adenylosuccinate synthase